MMEVKTPNTAAMVEKAAGAVAKKPKTAGAIDYLSSDNFKQQLAMALPKFFGADRFVRRKVLLHARPDIPFRRARARPPRRYRAIRPFRTASVAAASTSHRRPTASAIP